MASNEDITGDKARQADPVVDFEQCLRGLVKLQARVRGMIARRRVEKMLAEQRKTTGYQKMPKRKRLSSTVLH